MQPSFSAEDAVTHKLVSQAYGGSQQILCYCPSGPDMVDLAVRLQESFLMARPFSHVVIDGLFPDDVLSAVVAEVPGRDRPRWTVWGSGSRYKDAASGIKKGISNEALVGPVSNLRK